MDLKELELTGGDAASHWYYRAKSEMMLSHLNGLNLNRFAGLSAVTLARKPGA